MRKLVFRVDFRFEGVKVAADGFVLASVLAHVFGTGFYQSFSTKYARPPTASRE